MHPWCPAINTTTTETSFSYKERKEAMKTKEEKERNETREDRLKDAKAAKSRASNLSEALAELTALGHTDAHYSDDRSEVIWGRFSFLMEGTELKLYETRIRKLTPTECYRLMGFQRKDAESCFGAGQTKSNLYHQAGDSIVVTVLMGIFGEIFGLDYQKAIEAHSRALMAEAGDGTYVE